MDKRGTLLSSPASRSINGFQVGQSMAKLEVAARRLSRMPFAAGLGLLRLKYSERIIDGLGKPILRHFLVYMYIHSFAVLIVAAVESATGLPRWKLYTSKYHHFVLYLGKKHPRTPPHV